MEVSNWLEDVVDAKTALQSASNGRGIRRFKKSLHEFPGTQSAC